MSPRFWFALALPLCVAMPPRSAHSAEPPVNVVIIYADDLGYGDLACYGSQVNKTPNLDRLAAEGVRFTQFQSCCPFCAPSRCGLQTGRYPFRAGITTNPSPDAGINDIGMPDRETTLGEAFQSAGYATCCIGKWHLGHKPQYHPSRHGYDEYLGILYSHDMRPVELWDQDRVIEYPVVQATLTRRYTERALDFIERMKDRPFFLYMPHAMPHKPLAASEAFYKKSGNGLYADVMAELDWSVGQVVDQLDRLGLGERTLVLFSSDNGATYGGSNGNLRGMKGQVFEGGFRVPMIARMSGRVLAGHVCDEPASIIDFFPTALAAANVRVPAEVKLDGQNLMPLLTDRAAKSPHEALFTVRQPDVLTVRAGRWKLIAVASPATGARLKPGDPYTDWRAPDGVTILAPYEQAHPSQFPGIETGDTFKGNALFDLETDPTEQHDVAADHPEIVARLAKLVADLSAEWPKESTERRRLPPEKAKSRAK